ncbi:predicted protein [Naegleria gruberi]|uniref:Predicted protein n=1 Tax=Naegleria gruberi TaxID=5762 RepID=D2W2N5_NAEGR|nr:uncharacterized protein NAEGRDRAFT_54228 [Naegleria gruberi]EFC36647.1 predicted protein [Naegleria gruberi]|eukprot:XP_002669391.1 predicted protein [Naegleria gruberi strain NEG-M]
MDTTDEPEFVFDNDYIQHVDIAMDYADSGECIFSDNEGNLQGSIHLITESHTSKTLSGSVKKAIQTSSRSVCRLYVLYKSDCNKGIRSFGTAFFVSESLLMTAQHCIKPSHTIDGVVYFLKSTYIDLSCCSRDSQFEIDDSSLIKKVQIVDRSNFEKDIQQLKMPGKDVPWKTSNDFAFLELDQRNLTTPFIPVETTLEGNQCYVIGYPGTISIEKFKKDYCRDLDDTKSNQLWGKVQREMGYFECKIASQGTFQVKTGDYLYTHNCPTLCGTSGAPVVNENGKLIGIHVGGDYALHNNFWITISNQHLKSALISMKVCSDQSFVSLQ